MIANAKKILLHSCFLKHCACFLIVFLFGACGGSDADLSRKIAEEYRLKNKHTDRLILNTIEQLKIVEFKNVIDKDIVYIDFNDNEELVVKDMEDAVVSRDGWGRALQLSALPERGYGVYLLRSAGEDSMFGTHDDLWFVYSVAGDGFIEKHFGSQ